MSGQTKKEENLKANHSSANTSDMSDQIANIKATLINNGFTIENQVMTQKVLEIKKGFVNFQAGLKTIVEGENPVHILKIPNEIWELVFNQLDDPADIQNCFNTCQQFRSSCSSTQKTLIQIRKILPILVRTGHLTQTHLLNLRLTCKRINKCVDQLLQSNRFSWHEPITYDLIPFVYTLSPEQIRLMGMFGMLAKGHPIIRKEVLDHPQSRNPLISRCVDIHDVTNSLSESDYWQDQVIEFLQCWGKQIWYLTLRINCFKSRFLEFLKLTPNLKKLVLSCTLTDDDRDSLMGYGKLLKEACPKLVQLVFRGDKDIKLFVCSELVSAFSDQLRKFEVNTSSCLYSKLNWCNLKKLDVKGVNSLSSLCDLKADNLVSLRLSLFEKGKLDLFLAVVKKFKRLTELRVKFESGMEIGESDVLKMIESVNIDNGYSKVKFLYLDIKNCDKISMSILAWFPMLQVLNIKVENYTENARGDIDELCEKGTVKKDKVELKQIVHFDVRDLEASLAISNIWHVLPFLKEIMVNKLPVDSVEICRRQ